MSRTRVAGLLVMLGAALLPVTGRTAGDYPSRAIRVVVPFASAGVTDIVARVLFDRVSRSLGQTVVVDNRPGAGGTIGVEQVVNAPPDGYTLVMADPSGSLPANVTLYPALKYHPVRHLAPVAIVGTTGAVLLVTNSLPVRTAQELVALGRRKEGELTFASTGIGTPGHLNGELFIRLAGFQAVHVPYRVVGQGITDLIAGRTSFWIAPIPTMLQQVREGLLRPLAVAGEARSADLPEIPTMKETGIGSFDAATVYGVFAAAGTAADIIERLHAELRRALEDEDVRHRLQAAGVEPRIGTPADVTHMLETRIPQWAEVIKSAGIKIEQ
jgi:tripartite-type tricarboxylate transporter receptor subunit TctC